MLLLSCSQLSRGFDATPLFEDLGFELFSGQRVGLVGQSGGGKSTLFVLLQRQGNLLVVRQDSVVAIPRSSSTAHVRENYGALGITLSRRDLEEIDRAFPPPKDPQPLEVI